jgi:excisionase family DNA binding protein
MMPHCKTEGQFELFEDAAPAPSAHAPKIALPFQRSAEIDMRRIGKILGISSATVQRMIEAKLFNSYKIPGGRPRIEYESVVEYCNRLRLEYRITSNPLHKIRGRRYRDEQLLPFPLKDTITFAEVQRMLDCTKETVMRLIEEGRLSAYQVYIGMRGSPWRIQRSSFARYLESLKQPAAPSRDSSPTRL